VKLRKDNRFHILKSDKQKEDIKKYGNSRIFYAKKMLGNGKQGYHIKFDDLPADDQVVYVHRRNIITVANEDKEEVKCDHSNTDLDVMEGSEKKDTQQTLIKKLCETMNDEVMSADIFYRSTQQRIKLRGLFKQMENG